MVTSASTAAATVSRGLDMGGGLMGVCGASGLRGVGTGGPGAPVTASGAKQSERNRKDLREPQSGGSHGGATHAHAFLFEFSVRLCVGGSTQHTKSSLNPTS